MITGQALRDARGRANLSQEQLASLLDVTLRSVGNWERGNGVPSNRESRIRDLLGEHMDGTPSSLNEASDMALLAELGRRLARVGGTGGHDGSAPEAEKRGAVNDSGTQGSGSHDPGNPTAHG